MSSERFEGRDGKNPLGETRAEAEIRVGRHLSRAAMAEGIVNQIVGELAKKYNVIIKSTVHFEQDVDARGWTVDLEFAQYSALNTTENFFTFPSDVLRAQLMLVTR